MCRFLEVMCSELLQRPITHLEFNSLPITTLDDQPLQNHCCVQRENRILVGFTNTQVGLKLMGFFVQHPFIYRSLPVLPENGVRVCAALKTPFSSPPSHSQDPHFTIFFNSQDPTFTTKSQIFKNFKLKNLIIGRVQFQSLKLGQISISRGYILLRN